MNNQGVNNTTCLEAKERPLITLALFCYNQEKYIREAVKGAFSQTYSPLEIILSDDGSSDRSYDILQSLAAEYRGPHRVIVQRTAVNAGPWAHVLTVASRAQGELIVLAAGDDISLPNRVEALYKAWRETGAWGLYSRFDRINEIGDIEEYGCLPGKRGTVLSNYFFDGSSINLVHGATSAYDRRAFSLTALSTPDPIMSEDGVMTFLLKIHGKKTHFIEESLIHYRSHSHSISNAPQIRKANLKIIAGQQRKAAVYGQAFVNLNRFFLLLLDDLDPASLKKVKRDEIEAKLRFYKMLSRWIESGFMERLWFLIGSRHRTDILWMLPRLFGLTVFSIIKLLSLNLSRR